SLLFLFRRTSSTWSYTLSLHDALPILVRDILSQHLLGRHVIRSTHGKSSIGKPHTVGLCNSEVHQLGAAERVDVNVFRFYIAMRLEEHTSELQSRSDLVCRLLLEKKKK